MNSATYPISKNAEFLQQWVSTLNDEVVKSPCTPIYIHEETITDRIMRELMSHPEKTAVIEGFDQDRSLTCKEVHDQALSFAAFLTSRGFKTGDRVTIAMPNSIEWPAANLGTWLVGGTVVGSNAAYKLYETIYQLQDSCSSVVVTSEQTLETILEAAKECPEVKTIVCVRTSEKPLPEGVIDNADAISYAPLERAVEVTLDSVCLIIYSSGTTGQPKGVMHTHRAFHAAIEQRRAHFLHEVYPVLGGNPDEWFKEHQIVVTPCHHCFGFVTLNWSLVSGSPLVMMRAFDGEIYVEAVNKYKPRYLFLSPPIFAYLAKDPRGKAATLESVKATFCGAAPLGKELSDEFMSNHSNVKYILQGFGMTEVFASHLPLLLEEGVNSSVGVVGSIFKQKIIDPITGTPCMPGQPGEICVKGASQTIGYLNKPEATESLIDKDGWVHTGDIGYIDECGLLYIVDRMKELIKVNYLNQNIAVFPAEIEAVLIACASIKDAAVVGIPGIEGGELIRAYVVKANAMLTEEEVMKIIAEKLAEFKRITGGVVFLDVIPRNSAGKILRRELREL